MADEFDEVEAGLDELERNYMDLGVAMTMEAWVKVLGQSIPGEELVPYYEAVCDLLDIEIPHRVNLD